jgi:hypothetical protein
LAFIPIPTSLPVLNTHVETSLSSPIIVDYFKQLVKISLPIKYTYFGFSSDLAKGTTCWYASITGKLATMAYGQNNLFHGEQSAATLRLIDTIYYRHGSSKKLTEKITASDMDAIHRELYYRYFRTSPSRSLIGGTSTSLTKGEKRNFAYNYLKKLDPSYYLMGFTLSKSFEGVAGQGNYVYFHISAEKFYTMAKFSNIEQAFHVIANKHIFGPYGMTRLMVAMFVSSLMPGIYRKRTIKATGKKIPVFNRYPLKLSDAIPHVKYQVSVYRTPYDCGDGRYYYTAEEAKQAAIDHGAVVSMIYVTLIHDYCWAWGTVAYPSTPCPKEDFLRGYIHGG